MINFLKSTQSQFYQPKRELHKRQASQKHTENYMTAKLVQLVNPIKL